MNLDKAIEIIKRYEGCKLKAYLCPAGVWTIGWGETEGVCKDMEWTQNLADYYLLKRVNEIAVAINNLVKVKLNDNQLCALVSFVYNCGIGAFQKSTLFQEINSDRDSLKIKDEFMKWVTAKGVRLQGLVNRRDAEAKLYFS